MPSGRIPALFALLCFFPALLAAQNNTMTPADYVDPLIDSANSRWFFFSSASRPFGMVNLSPDTETSGAWGSGYRYDTEFVRAISHVHAWQLSGLPVLPVTGDVDPRSGEDAYGSPFSHARETVNAGYHALFLEKYAVRAELTSTTRVGWHRYHFPGGKKRSLIFDLGMELGPSGMLEAEFSKVNATEFQGYITCAPTRRRPKATRIYFAISVNQPVEHLTAWQGEQDLGRVSRFQGEDGGVQLHFPNTGNDTLLMKVGISYVSAEKARHNMNVESPHWDFDRVRRESKAEWNDWLGKIRIKGGPHQQRVKFYTDLWHALLGRRIVSDVDGTYSDMTGPEQRIRQIPLGENGKPRYNHYNSDAFWGAQWNLNILWTLVYPSLASEFVNSLVDMYKNGGLLPRGPSGGNYTFVMVGAQTTLFIVSAYTKGIRDFDIDSAYEGMRKNHFPGGLMSKAGYEHDTATGGGIEYYIERGYVPSGIPGSAYHRAGAGQTLEYAFQDWALAQMAGLLGKREDEELFLQRAKNYINLYNAETGYMHPRGFSGEWIADYDPSQRRRNAAVQYFVESNGHQATWYVPHDAAGLIRLIGGRSAFNRRLNSLFEAASAHNFVSAHDDYTDVLNYGNQICLHIAHLFNYSGAPWLAQKWSRAVFDQALSGITPHSGYNDDEDQGQIGALGVLLAMGLFDVRGGAAAEPIYELTAPVFSEINIALDPDYYAGESIRILAPEASSSHFYVQRVSLNGTPLNQPWVMHKDLIKGGEIRYELGAEPNKQWGRAVSAAPPSMSDPR